MASTTPNSQTILVCKSRKLRWNPLLRTSLVKLPRTTRQKFNPETSKLNIKCFFMNNHHDLKNNNNDINSRNCGSIIVKQKCIEEIESKENSSMQILNMLTWPGLSLEGKGISSSGWKFNSDSWDNLGKIVCKAVKGLQKVAMAAFLFGVVLLMSKSKLAFAASGGRMGGKSFSSSSSSSSSRVYTLPRTGDWPDFSNSAAPYFAPSPSSFNCGGGAAVYVRPAVGAGSSFSYIMMGFTAFVLVSGFLSGQAEGDLLTAFEKTSVVKIQVGLLGMARSLQGDLNRIAEAADTSCPEGLHYVLTETILALLRYPSYWISACSSVDVKQSVEGGEKTFNQLSVEERSKFDKETLINVNNIRIQTATSQRASVFSNKYIVVTLLVAAAGLYRLPTINSSSDLKDALQKLASIPSSGTMAVEVLWTPQNGNDSLSERELIEDYPLLQPL